MIFRPTGKCPSNDEIGRIEDVSVIKGWEFTTSWRLDDWIGCVCLYAFEEQTFLKQQAVYEIYSILQRSSFSDVMNNPHMGADDSGLNRTGRTLFSEFQAFFLITTIHLDGSIFKIFIFWHNFNVRDFKACKKKKHATDLLWQMFRFLTFWHTNSELTKNSCNGPSQLSLSDLFP